MTLIRPQIAQMDTDYFERRIKTDDTDFTNYSLEREFDVTREFGTSGPKMGRPQIAQMDTDYFGQRIKTDDTNTTTDCTDGHGLFWTTD